MKNFSTFDEERRERQEADERQHIIKRLIELHVQ